MGWCIISGISHAEWMVYKTEYLNEAEFNRTSFAGNSQYVYPEAHNELMTVFFKMLADGKLDMVDQWWMKSNACRKCLYKYKNLLQKFNKIVRLIYRKFRKGGGQYDNENIEKD